MKEVEKQLISNIKKVFDLTGYDYIDMGWYMLDDITSRGKNTWTITAGSPNRVVINSLIEMPWSELFPHELEMVFKAIRRESIEKLTNEHGYKIIRFPESQHIFSLANVRENVGLIMDNLGIELFGCDAYIVNADWYAKAKSADDDTEEQILSNAEFTEDENGFIWYEIGR